MKIQLKRSLSWPLLLSFGLWAFSSVLLAQSPASTEVAGPSLPPGTLDLPPGAGTRTDSKKLPNFSGVWFKVEGLAHPDQIKIIPFMKPDAAAEWQKKIDAKNFHVPWSYCEPPAFPALMTEIGLPFEILMTTGRVTLIVPDGEVRRIYTDGSQHGESLPGATYFGNSIGHWQGDTLVIETTDLRSDNNVVMGLQAGTDHMKVEERWQLIAPDKLQNQMTVTSLDYLKTPYKVTQVYQRFPQLRLTEFICLASKNRNTGDSVDLTPPPL